MTQTMKVLMAVDDTEQSEHLVHFLVRSIRSDDTEVLVLSVVQQMYPAAFEMDRHYAPELEGERNIVQGRVDQIASHLKECGFKAFSVVRIGDARECILNLSLEWAADLIVLSCDGHGVFQHLLFGGVAELVARRARCSFAIVRRRSDA